MTLKTEGTVDKTIIGSITEALKADSEHEKDFNRLEKIFQAESLQMVSFTITEKGYELKNSQGEYQKDVVEDFLYGVIKPKSYLGKIAYFLYKRYLFGAYPIALVSMDNYAHNGDKLKASILEIAQQWYDNKLVDKDFVDYLKNPKKVSYPWTMIDKITPRPDSSVEAILNKIGFEDMAPQKTTKNTYVSSFVNAEETGYLIIEDHFPNGKPALDQVGAIFTTKEVVDQVEKMKVGTCLNPLHTALAIYGCLLGYQKISDEMKNKDLVNLIKKIGYDEGLPVVVNPKILDPKQFIDTVIDVRLPNPFMPDTPQRIATDTSQKLPIRFGQTIKAYQQSKTLDVKNLKYIPLVYAGYIRYLLGINDHGEVFEISSDPRLKELKEKIKTISEGKAATKEELDEILRDEKLWGVDLKQVGLADLVVKYFNQLNQGVGAVAATLAYYLG